MSGHTYPPDFSVYCRLTTRVRANVLEDDDLVDGNVVLYLEWGGGYMEPLFNGAAGSSPLAGRSFGIGALESVWNNPAGSTWKVDGNGGVYGPGSLSNLIPSKLQSQHPWLSRGRAIDMSFDAVHGSGRGGVVLRGNENFGFEVVLERATSRVNVYRRFGAGVSTKVLSGTTVLVPGVKYGVRVTADLDDVWNVYVDGVSQGTFTNSTVNTQTLFGLLSSDSDTVLSNIKFLPTGPCPAETYEVINDAGEVVASGDVSGYTIEIPDEVLVQANGRGPYGGYKVRLYGPTKTNYLTASGDCQFVRVRLDTGFAAKPDRYYHYSQPGNSSGWDVSLRSFFGLGATRVAYDDGDWVASAGYLNTNYRAHEYPSRPRHTIGHYRGDNSTRDAEITAFVAANSDIFDAWEPRNEPNFGPVSATDFVAEQQAFYNAVKAGNPDAIVLGPNTVSYNYGWMYWLEAFLAAGGADYLDGISVHGYNCSNGDIAMTRRQLDALNAIADEHNLPLWQTEHSHFAQYGFVVMPSHALHWNAVQLMVQETRGIPIERNVLWYDVDHGYIYSTLWETRGNGTFSVPVTVRTMVAELGDRTFDSEFDLGSMADLYVCAKWVGADGSATVGVLAQSNGQPPVRFYLNGAETVECCDAWGNEFTATRGESRIVEIVTEDIPTWVRVPAGVSLTIVPEWGYGTNLALNASVTSTAATTVNAAALVTEYLENQYELDDGGDPVVGALRNFETYNGTKEGTNTFPITVTAELATPGPMTTVVLIAPAVWQTWFSSPIDFDIDVSADGATWTTVLTQSPPATVTSTPFVSDLIGSGGLHDTWFFPPTVWRATFTQQRVTHVRVVIREASWGGHETELESYVTWGAEWNSVVLRGLRAYDADDFDPNERQRFNLTVTCSG